MQNLKIFFFLLISLIGSTILNAQNLSELSQRDSLVAQLNRARVANDQKKLASTYLALARIEEDFFFNPEKSFEYYTTSQEYYKILKDSSQVIAIDQKIAKRYLETGLYTDAEKIYNRLFSYYSSRKDTLMVLSSYLDLAELSKKRGNTDDQYKYLKHALKLNRLFGNTEYELKLLLQKADVLEGFNEIDSAIIVSFDAFKISKAIGRMDFGSKSLYLIGKYNRIKANYNRAIKYLEQAVSFISITPYDKQRLILYKELSSCYEQVEDHASAFDFLQRYTALNDSILNKERIQSLNEIQRKFQTKEKNKNIINLEKEKDYIETKNSQQRIALYLLAAGLTLLLILLYYIVRYYSHKINTRSIISAQTEEINKRKIKQLEDNIKISSMQSMIEGQELERERVAQDLHDSLGGLLATVKLAFDGVTVKNKGLDKSKEFKHASKLIDTAVTEVRSISQNMQPVALKELGLVAAIKDLINRFDEEQYPEIDFQYYDIPNPLPASVSLSLYRVIQEMLHNSIKHAEAEEILIQINKEDDHLVIQYEDDGKGFDPKKLKRKGMGLNNLSSRINYLKGKLELDTTPNKGTSYLISVAYDQ